MPIPRKSLSSVRKAVAPAARVMYGLVELLKDEKDEVEEASRREEDVERQPTHWGGMTSYSQRVLEPGDWGLWMRPPKRTTREPRRETEWP